MTRNLIRPLTILLLAFVSATLHAQSSYFQQQVDYKIDVRLDPERGRLHADMRMVYHNQSPNTLTEIWIHLWPNAYKDRKTAWAKQKLRNGASDFYHSKREERGYIDSLAFRVNGEYRRLIPHPEHGDIARLPLPNPLAPGDSVVITTPFRVQVPKSFSRLGRTGEQYQVTQWYPKPAVFDHKGWHPMPYLDQGEFYSEFGTFDVSITVPEHYVVGATGRLVNNPQEQEFMRRREAQSRQLLRSGDVDDLDTPFEPPMAPRQKTLRFVQENIHDFAWFCDPQYFVMTEKARLRSGKEVELIAMFAAHDESDVWTKATQYLSEGVRFYSQIVGEYPYTRCTAVDGALSAGAGMEYPMITVVSAKGGAAVLRETIIHEVGHNWFYGILASNERDFPWMDEGFNSYVEHRAVRLALAEDRKNGAGGRNPLENPESSFNLSKMLTGKVNELGFAYSQGANSNQPLTLHSDEYGHINYGLDVYARMSLVLEYLEKYLGEQLMDECLQNYFKEWGNRHPYPSDMKASFEKTSKQDLSWFFDELLPSADPVRLKMERVELLPDGRLEVEVSNNSAYRLPARLTVLGAKGDTLSQGWLPPFLGKSKTTLLVKGEAKRVVVGTDSELVEPNENNNFNGCSSPALKMGLRISPRYDRRDLNILPAYGYNSRDGNMLGALLYYQPFPKRNLEFHALPMYSLPEERWTGSAGFTLRANQFPYGHALRKLEFRSRGALFADLLRVKHELSFYFAAPRPSRARTSVLTLRTHQLGWREANGDIELADDFRSYYTAADWLYEQDRKVFRWGFRAEVGGRDAGSLRAQIAPQLYWEPCKGYKMNLRLFAGAFLERNSVPLALQYRLSGSFDPFGEEYYLDRRNFLPAGEAPALPLTRETGFWSRQIIEDQGGFRSILLLPGTDRWMAAVNYSLKLPYFVEMFVNYGVQPNAAGKGLDYYDAGVTLRVIDRVLHVNFPIAGSVYGEDTPQTWKQFGQQINFTLQLNEAIKRVQM